ncbi:hypothetical protein OK351_12090 [Glutamicibacter sp. MNS18]|uniref:hypothetical protein n=1 Tax=Glutamicibacter sp. MNS18 TaxID=2989817 RepID=UPI002236889A|nr:hypothetical protein [Glutamicibacter sp. MNS18]MCW4466238.1 hypothetical protein [Glutamicibacter sp. MNS18]
MPRYEEDDEMVTAGQWVIRDDRSPMNTSAAYRIVEPVTHPKGTYSGIDTIKKHQELVRAIGGEIRFSDNK